MDFFSFPDFFDLLEKRSLSRQFIVAFNTSGCLVGMDRCVMEAEKAKK
jgi:hypothetical protein